jgi:AP-1 complex subunit gamma-1
VLCSKRTCLFDLYQLSCIFLVAVIKNRLIFCFYCLVIFIYYHLVGYPTHFGQLECMKLTASPHFPEKRIGYLGMLLLLSEEAEVLMLATNALKSDLTSNNKFVAGLALCAIGNLATADMSRDLAPEVDKHLKSNLPYLRKKACLAMARCLSKCPDMVEDFVDRVVTLLKDKSHGVLITVVQLMTQVVIIDFRNAEEEGQDPYETPCRASFLRLVPTLVKMLRNLLGSGYATEHEVGGISDPFLQVQLLTLLRLLGSGNVQASEEMNDVLAQVATNTETSKNAGNAILYECVQTIMGTESEDGLRVLAVNILGRFLLNRDNNIRYVALNTLSKCIVDQNQSGRTGDAMPVSMDGATAGGEANNAMSALQRHRTTVVDCLKDPDVSIRQRALELIYHLVNESNVESLTAELLNYLVLCSREHRGDISTRILKVVDRFSPNDRWRVDTLITTLTIAGREASLAVQSAAVVYISRSSTDIHSFASHKLSKAIRDDDGSQHGLLAVGIWCIGEYGDLLLRPYTYTTPSMSGGEDGLTTSNGDVTITFNSMDPLSVISTIEDVTKRHSCPDFVKERALTAYAKLSDRFKDKGDPAALEKLTKLLKKHQTSRALELQLRACEYNTLISAAKGISEAPPKKDSIAEDDLFGVSGGATDNGGGGTVSNGVMSAAKEALARMPVVDIKVLQKRLSTDEFSIGDSDSPQRASRSLPTAAAAKPAGGGDLLDLIDVFGAAEASGGASTAAALTQNGSTGPVASSGGGSSDLDLLADIFSAQASTVPVPVAASTGTVVDMFGAPPSSSQPAAVNPMDLFGAPPTSSAASTFSAPAAPVGGGVDLFGAPAAPLPPSRQPAMDIFGGGSTAPAAASPTGVRVQALNHMGLAVEFECIKPDTWNKQKSTLIAHFKNTTGDVIYGMNLQVAVPKHVQMEMQPPSSTTIPVTGGNNKPVTQQVNVTNSMLGTKNLVLKMKIGFTSKGQKIEHMATCSGFPAGEY